MTLSDANNASMVFLSPLWFGAGLWRSFPSVFGLYWRPCAAHLHHGWDLYNRFGKTRAALKRAIVTVCTDALSWARLPRSLTCILSVSQQLMTSLFGCFEAFVFVRTGESGFYRIAYNHLTYKILGSILPCIFAHSFCNLYGVPFPMEALRDHPRRKIGEHHRLIRCIYMYWVLFRYPYYSFHRLYRLLFSSWALDSLLNIDRIYCTQ